MRVFITGATGYVGHQLALKLAKENYMVHALVRDVNSANLPMDKNIIIYEGDLCDYDSVIAAMKGCVYVFHTAAYTNLKCKSIANFYNSNVLGTENILKAALELGVNKVVFTSTLSVFGPSYKQNPITEEQPRLTSYANDYELTKSMSEEIVLNYVKKGLSCVILNLTRVFGPGLNTFSNGVNKLVTLIAEKNVLIVPSKLNVVSNYVFIEDVIDAHLLAIQNGKSGEKYIIGGENMNYDELLYKIKDFTKSRIKILKLNYDLFKKSLFLSSKIFGLLGHGSTITPKDLDTIFINRGASSQKAISQLHYKITPFNTGLHQTINFLSK